jgi:manganese transport protein
VAIVPALIVAIYYGEQATGMLLVGSQVVLSLQLSFAVFPLVAFTSSTEKMGVFANKKRLKITTYAIAFFIGGLNLYLVWQAAFS